MEPVIYMSVGAAGVVSLICLRLAARHGWAFVQSRIKQRAAAAESAFRARMTAAAGDIDARIHDVVHSELARLESDIAALKVKVGA